MVKGNEWMMGGAAIAAIGALLHVAVVLGGPAWYEFFGAPPQVVELARRGHWSAPAATLGIAAAMAVCTAYALAGAGVLPALPLQRLVLTAVALLCLLRAVLLVPFMLATPQLAGAIEVASSVVFLLAGICYAAGTWPLWQVG